MATESPSTVVAPQDEREVAPSFDAARRDWLRVWDVVRGIRPRDLLRFALVVGALWLVAWILWQARDALLPFVIGTVLAYLCLPLVNRLNRRLPRPVAILLVFLGGVLVVAAALAAVVPPLATQVVRLTDAIPDMATITRLVAALQGFYRRLPPEQQRFIEDGLTGALDAARDNAVGYLRTAGTVLLGGVFNVFNVFSFLLGFLVLPFWLFYVLKDQPAGHRAVDRLLAPPLRADFWAVVRIVDRVLGRFIRGQLLLALTVAVMAFVGLTALQLLGVPGIQYTVVLAALAGVAELIPLVGPILSAVPAVLVGLASSWQTALIVALLYLVIQQLENNLLAPRVIGQSIEVHPAVLMVALIVASHFGFLWVVLAAPLLAIARELFRYAHGRLRNPPRPAGVLPGDLPAPGPGDRAEADPATA